MRQLWTTTNVFLFATLLSCNNPTVDTNEQGKESQDSIVRPYTYQLSNEGEAASFYTQVLYKTEEDTLNYLREDIAKIVLQFPVIDSFEDAAIKDSVNNLINSILLKEETGDLAYPSVDERLKEFIATYLDYEQEMRSFGLLHSPKWVNVVKIEVLLNTPYFMTFKVYEREFTGGAHANSSMRFFNVNMENGKLVNLDDVFVEDYRDSLLSVAEVAFKQALSLPVDTNLAQTNFEFPQGTYRLPEHFSLQTQTIGFHYNPYDLGPFSMGRVSFEIEYERILPILNTAFISLDTIVQTDTITNIPQHE